MSGTEVGQRIRQHTNVITAAKDAGVHLIAYTSIAHAPPRRCLSARSTELPRRRSPTPAFRACCFATAGTSTPTAQLPAYLQHGIVGAADDGPISGATRADYADAAAAVLAANGHGGAVYELGGPAFTMPELAEVVSEATGESVKYADLSVQDYQAFLVRAGCRNPLRLRLLTLTAPSPQANSTSTPSTSRICWGGQPLHCVPP